jgi:DNA-binding LacI/PurR family transcriptional regulator
MEGLPVGVPTVYDVAARASVSIATVSRVYRKPDSVRAQTRDRVLAAARELGYVPSGNARGLASRSTGVLGLPLPQALVFANDQMAIGALDVLERRGVRVPEDMAVVGFDGIPLGRVARPSLTTVTQPMRLLGETAVDLLVERLAEPTREPRSVLLPVIQTRRASCGCPVGEVS